MDKNNYYFFIYNGLPPNNSYFQKVITNILTQKHGVIQNKRYICNLISWIKHTLIEKTMMYWQKEIETMDRKDLVKFQLERLKQTIELAGNSPFYHKGTSIN